MRKSEFIDINSIQNKFTSDKVKYNSSPIDEALEKLNKAVELLDTTIPADLQRISSKEHLWKGRSKEEYDALKSLYSQYREDFADAVGKYQNVAEGANSLFHRIPSAKVLREVENT